MTEPRTKNTPKLGRPKFVDEADADRMRADAERMRADALKLAADTRKAEAETRKSNAEAEKAEYSAALEKIGLDREDEERKRELTHDLYHHTYVFAGSVGDASVSACISQLNYWRRTEDAKGGKIQIVFYSPGGSVIAGMALFDHILSMRKEGWHFTTVARGYAASMAGILIQAGDVRACGPESYILIHEIATMTGGKIGEIEDEVVFLKKIGERVVDIFAERSKLTKATIRRRMRRRDWWIDSTEALKVKLVDKIL